MYKYKYLCVYRYIALGEYSKNSIERSMISNEKKIPDSKT